LSCDTGEGFFTFPIPHGGYVFKPSHEVGSNPRDDVAPVNVSANSGHVLAHVYTGANMEPPFRPFINSYALGLLLDFTNTKGTLSGTASVFSGGIEAFAKREDDGSWTLVTNNNIGYAKCYPFGGSFELDPT
jgi:hypothetical protein